MAIGRPPVPLIERFWEKVRIPNSPSDCWEWQAHIDAWGYGKIWDNALQRCVFAHRFSYESAYGQIPPNLYVDHLCRNPRCVNPLHLELVTGRVNILRGTGKGANNAAKTHCPRGHPYSGVNNLGRRICHKCGNAAGLRYRSKKAATGTSHRP